VGENVKNSKERRGGDNRERTMVRGTGGTRKGEGGRKKKGRGKGGGHGSPIEGELSGIDKREQHK